MGDRAVITASEDVDVKNSNDIGVYIHWNGDINWVTAFLKYCKQQGFRIPEKDNYGWARLCQVIGNYFGADGLSVGIDKCCNLDCDNYDNGVYIIKKWEIIGRKYKPDWEEKVDENMVDDIIHDIDNCQPESMRLFQK